MTKQDFDCQRILLALAGSSLAEAAYPYAIGLAQASGAEIVLARVAEWYWPPLTDGLDGCDDRKVEDQTEELICQEYLDQLAALHQGSGVRLSTVVMRGDPVHCLTQCATEAGVDLIIMTPRGLGGLKRMVLGSVAELVLHKAKQPVMLIPAAAVKNGERQFQRQRESA